MLTESSMDVPWGKAIEKPGRLWRISDRAPSVPSFRSNSTANRPTVACKLSVVVCPCTQDNAASPLGWRRFALTDSRGVTKWRYG